MQVHGLSKSISDEVVNTKGVGLENERARVALENERARVALERAVDCHDGIKRNGLMSVNCQRKFLVVVVRAVHVDIHIVVHPSESTPKHQRPIKNLQRLNSRRDAVAREKVLVKK